MSYIEDFLERNKEKSFITNLNKYFNLNHYGKCKVLSSFLTHLYIDAEQIENLGGDDFNENIKIQQEILSMLSEMTFYKIDNFIEWLENQLSE